MKSAKGRANRGDGVVLIKCKSSFFVRAYLLIQFKCMRYGSNLHSSHTRDDNSDIIGLTETRWRRFRMRAINYLALAFLRVLMCKFGYLFINDRVIASQTTNLC